MNTDNAVSILLGTKPGDLREAAKKLYAHSREVDMLYADLLVFLAQKTDVLAALPPDLFSRMEAFNNRMMQEKK